MKNCNCDPKSMSELCVKCQMEYNEWLETVELAADFDAHLEAIEMGLQALEDKGFCNEN
jgi:hypothetical protein